MNKPRRILIVDDNPNNREVFHEMLDGSYQLFDAANGWDALTIAEQIVPRIVLLDVMLPIMDGYEVCRKLRSMPRRRASSGRSGSRRGRPS